jgi:LysM repeat protein
LNAPDQYFGIFAKPHHIVMKTVCLFLSIVFISTTSVGQSEQFIVRNGNKGPYVEHKVTAKENFYSIGRLFNVHPKHLALFNSLDMSKGLGLGQTVRIPLSDTNYTHKSEIGTPVYYVTNANETIYNVSTTNGVLMEKLRKWNQVSSDKLPSGTKLVVGYLMNAQNQAVAVNSTRGADSAGKNPIDASKNAVRPDAADKGPSKKQDAKKDDGKASQNANVDEGKKSVKKKDEVKKSTDTTERKGTQLNSSVAEGYFKSFFEQQAKQQPVSRDQTVTAGIFKTSSGWVDAKYYLLMDGEEPGTIVRITNPANHRTIYAKLLGGMNDLRQNQGLNIRISNAGASALEISETDKFIVKLSY